MFVWNKIFRNQILQIKKRSSQIGRKMRKISLVVCTLILEEKFTILGHFLTENWNPHRWKTSDFLFGICRESIILLKSRNTFEGIWGESIHPTVFVWPFSAHFNTVVCRIWQLCYHDSSIGVNDWLRRTNTIRPYKRWNNWVNWILLKQKRKKPMKKLSQRNKLSIYRGLLM